MSQPVSHVPAPGLVEVAGAWWDVDREPVVAWSQDACTFWLHDVIDETLTLELVTLGVPSPDPRRVAQILAEGLAGCDFPPTGDGADPAIVARTLTAHGVS
ncbi:MAG: hypothetical protein ACI9AD_000565 [Nitriliruptoraceae bacterium]|jgi:hypothetical protein